jgi:hypothetical protein
VIFMHITIAIVVFYVEILRRRDTYMKIVGKKHGKKRRDPV